MIDLIAHMQTFVRTAEAGSFTAVADERGTSQPTISRQIAALEAHLGCLLFQRTTRSLSLTDDGRIFYDHARRTLETASEAQEVVGKRRGRPSGTLRLACSVVLGRLHLMPRLRAFLDQYPDLDVDLVLNDGFTDLIEEGIDLAIRVGEITDPSLVGRRIGTTRRIVVAASSYLDKRGEPQSAKDLGAHDCIVYSQLAVGANWTFDTDSGPVNVPIRGRVRVSSTEGVRTAILQGLGIGFVPAWHFVDNEFETGKLKVLLPAFAPHPQPISAVYPTRRYLSPKVRVMIDYLAGEFANDMALSGMIRK
jgi:DNA-binding transcriptional LysR family regulator